MHIGIGVNTPAYRVDVAFIARKAEELGFESLWYAEHPAVPVRSESRHPIRASISDLSHFAHFVDPFVALARASGATSSIKLGTAICLVPQRNPLLLAKEIATLDLVSRGRFLFGVGVGWLREETEMMGGDFDHRWTQAREAVLVMKKLWTKDAAEHYGRYYRFPPVRSFPKPAQVPHPPVLLGGMAKNVFKRVAAWGDGWLPNMATPALVREGRAALDDLAADAGRDPASITITVDHSPWPPDWETLHGLAEAGADRVVIRPSAPQSEEEVSANLEWVAENVAALRSEQRQP